MWRESLISDGCGLAAASDKHHIWRGGEEMLEERDIFEGTICFGVCAHVCVRACVGANLCWVMNGCCRYLSRLCLNGFVVTMTGQASGKGADKSSLGLATTNINGNKLGLLVWSLLLF